VDLRLHVVAVFVSDYASKRFADDRPGIGGVDAEPSLASECRWRGTMALSVYATLILTQLLRQTDLGFIVFLSRSLSAVRYKSFATGAARINRLLIRWSRIHHRRR
jgi:hypothetical protein